MRSPSTALCSHPGRSNRERLDDVRESYSRRAVHVLAPRRERAPRAGDAARRLPRDVQLSARRELRPALFGDPLAPGTALIQNLFSDAEAPYRALESLMNIGFGLLAAELKANPGFRVEELLKRETSA